MAYLVLVLAHIPRISEFLFKARKLPLPHRKEIHRDEGGVVGEMFKEGTVLREKFPYHGLAVVLIARPEDMMVRAHDIAD